GRVQIAHDEDLEGAGGEPLLVVLVEARGVDPVQSLDPAVLVDAVGPAPVHLLDEPDDGVLALVVDQTLDGPAEVLPLLLHIRRVEARRSEEHTSELQSRENLVCRLLLEKKNIDRPHRSRTNTR